MNAPSEVRDCLSTSTRLHQFNVSAAFPHLSGEIDFGDK